MQQKNVHWFPGHMVKAMREIESRMSVIDLIIEVVDSRTPLSSKNPFLEKITNNKKRLIVFTKKDLCDEEKLIPFTKYYNDKGYETVLVDLNEKKDVLKIIDIAFKLGEEKRQKNIKRGMKPQALRMMIIGIPNVGKSTLINRLAKRNAASVQNTPGHTKAQQWIRINKDFELLDTPGILPPHYEDKIVATNLALVGSIKEDILPLDELYEKLMEFLIKNYPANLAKRYNISCDKDLSIITENIAKNRGFLLKGGMIDEESTKRMILKEFKDGVITPVVLDELC